METMIAVNQMEKIIFDAAKRINQEKSNWERYKDESFLIEKFYLLDTLDKMMKVIRLCDWTFGHNVIKTILTHINWNELSTRRIIQLVKRSQVNPEVLKNFIILSKGKHDNEIIECVGYAVNIDFFCYPNSNRIYHSYENMFGKLVKEDPISPKLTMYLLGAFKGWKTDFLKYSVDVIDWQNLSNKEWLDISNKYSIFRNSSHPELLDLYRSVFKKLPFETFNNNELDYLHL